MENKCKRPIVDFRVSEYEKQKFREAKAKLNLSARDVITQLCRACDLNEFIIYDKKGEKSITLNKNFLCKKR